MEPCGTEGGRVTLSCVHSFCRQCIATHAARQVRHDLAASCPLCKGELTEAEVESCGPAREMQEESDDEDGGEQEVLIIMEFDGEDDGEKGFWIMFDPGEGVEDDSEEEDSGEEDEDEQDEDDEDGDVETSRDAAGNESGGDGVKALLKGDGEGKGGRGNAGGEDKQEPAAEEEGGSDDGEYQEATDDPRPYGGWRWSASHHAWVGNASVTCPPPREPPTDFDGPDPLAGQQIEGVLAVHGISMDEDGDLEEEDGDLGDLEEEDGDLDDLDAIAAEEGAEGSAPEGDEDAPAANKGEEAAAGAEAPINLSGYELFKCSGGGDCGPHAYNGNNFRRDAHRLVRLSGLHTEASPDFTLRPLRTSH